MKRKSNKTKGKIWAQTNDVLNVILSKNLDPEKADKVERALFSFLNRLFFIERVSLRRI